MSFGEICGAVGAPLSYADLQELGGLTGIFSRHAPLELEVGCGRGDFLLAYASRRPGVNFIGVERKLVIARRAASKLGRAGLTNVRIIHGEIGYLVDRYLPMNSLHAIHCYFPDPWPKKRHAKRRLFREGTQELFAKLLQPGGWVHIRTDVPAYFEAICALFDSSPLFQQVEPPRDLVDCLTGFERRFVAEGKPIYRVSYRREPISQSRSALVKNKVE
ncbi:MAG: tRNA (guanosine(46)-N7)-methyltransferase TrmB [Candidatus Sumerlaeaceae bacterium]